MRKFAIGDIHGCLDKLEDLLSKIDPRPDDVLIFLGDYIDRGENTKEVIETLIKLSSHCECIFLRGNHEDMFIEYMEFGTNRGIFLSNGGDMTILSYTGEKIASGKMLSSALPHDHKRFMTTLKWLHEDDRYIYVHAGIRAGIPLVFQDRMDLIWIRQEFYKAPTGVDKKIIFGHSPFIEPFIRNDKIGIDTGAVYGRCLTAIELPSERFIFSFS
jgi:serine/threonine protein phosphatase 1